MNGEEAWKEALRCPFHLESRDLRKPAQVVRDTATLQDQMWYGGVAENSQSLVLNLSACIRRVRAT